MALLAASLGISITSVVLGATNLNSNCTGISQLPAYLITSGVLGIVAFLLHSSDKNEEETEDGKKKDSAALNLVRLASLGVLIWGSVILFDAEKPTCDRVLYDYAFAVLLTAYAFLAVFVLITCCTFSVVFCDACANHCCCDGDGELTYHCHCCGLTLCADDATRAKVKQAKAAKPKAPTRLETVNKSDIIIDMQTLQKTNIAEFKDVSGTCSDA
jgi:hypothetical protein